MNFNPIIIMPRCINKGYWLKINKIVYMHKRHEITWCNTKKNPNLCHVQVEDHGNYQQHGQSLLIASFKTNSLDISCFDYK